MEQTWIVEVLADLKRFSRANGMACLADELARTEAVARREVARTDPPARREERPPNLPPEG